MSSARCHWKVKRLNGAGFAMPAFGFFRTIPGEEYDLSPSIYSWHYPFRGVNNALHHEDLKRCIRGFEQRRCEIWHTAHRNSTHFFTETWRTASNFHRVSTFTGSPIALVKSPLGFLTTLHRYCNYLFPLLAHRLTLHCCGRLLPLALTRARLVGATHSCAS